MTWNIQISCCDWKYFPFLIFVFIWSSLDLKTGTVTSRWSKAVWQCINCDLILCQFGLQVSVKNTCRHPYFETKTNAFLVNPLMWRLDPWTLLGRYDSFLGSSMYQAPCRSLSSGSSSTLYLFFLCLGWPINICSLMCLVMLILWSQICEDKSNSQYWANLFIIMNRLTLRCRHKRMQSWPSWSISSSNSNGLPVQPSMT